MGERIASREKDGKTWMDREFLSGSRLPVIGEKRKPETIACASGDPSACRQSRRRMIGMASVSHACPPTSAAVSIYIHLLVPFSSTHPA